MEVGELLGCLFCIFMLSLSTVLCIKLAIRFQANMAVVRFIMFGLWVLLADQFGGGMLALAGAVRSQPKAEAQLGLNYLQGRMPGAYKSYSLFWPKNPDRGRYWLDKASTSGNASAEAVLGSAYLDGNSGLPHDPFSAIKHLTNVADNRNAEPDLRISSALLLADIYDKGDGSVAQNPIMAVKYKMIAADSNPTTALEVAQGLEKGRWGEPDYARAYVYYKKAFEGGNAAAVEGYARLKTQLGQK